MGRRNAPVIQYCRIGLAEDRFAHASIVGMPDPLTPQDRLLHLEELERLRQTLFRRRTPAQCFIAQEEVIAPRTLRRVNVETHHPTRDLLRGGLKFELHFPAAPALHWISVEHCGGDDYWIFANFNTLDKPDSRFTRLSLTVPYEGLEQRFLMSIGTLLKESR